MTPAVTSTEAANQAKRFSIQASARRDTIRCRPRSWADDHARIPRLARVARVCGVSERIRPPNNVKTDKEFHCEAFLRCARRRTKRGSANKAAPQPHQMLHGNMSLG